MSEKYYRQKEWLGIWNEITELNEGARVMHAMYHAWRDSMLNKFAWQFHAGCAWLIAIMFMIIAIMEQK